MDVQKKILHLFPIEKFTRGFIEFINRNFDSEVHHFLVWGDRSDSLGYEYIRYDNVTYVPDIGVELRKADSDLKMQVYEKIIYHGVFQNAVISYFYHNKGLLKKLYLYFWGGDKNLSGTFQNKFMKKYVIRNAKGILTIVKGDYQDISHTYHPKGKWYCIRYYDNKATQMRSLMKNIEKSENEIYIQVGNSATETNNHIEVLDVISKYKKERIKIFLPLSYGDSNYAKEVIEYGKNIFGEKLIAMQDFMSMEEYQDFLRGIDVAIFGMMRQQALGNIISLLIYGAKIYIYKESILTDCLKNEWKCKIHDIEEISKLSFEDFYYISEEERAYNRKKMLEESCDESRRVEAWKRIFSNQ